jgi:glutamine synthetase
MKIKLEYVWIDGYKPEPNLRSKVKVIDVNEKGDLKEIPEWGFDGSSTKQAEGYSSDCYLKPIKLYIKSVISEYSTVYVLCEVIDNKGKVHETNDRAKLGKEDEDFWVGFEQEYFIRSGHNKPIIGFNNGGIIDPQGTYYCGVGGQMVGRSLTEEHLDMCLNYGIGIEGTNAEVAIGQWEYQVFAKGKVQAADDLWMSRYFLYKIAEKHGYQIELHPKPLTTGDWNGSGLHTNFSNKRMRETGGEEYFNSIFKVFESRAKIHIENYGSDNHLRLTGKHETQSIDKFSWGVSDRGASIRVPKSVGETWKGYLEDRRPASNANPYCILNVICESLELAKELDDTLHVMYDDIDTSKLSEKFGTISAHELLNEYQNDIEAEFDDMVQLMESRANVPTEEIKFNLNGKQ